MLNTSIIIFVGVATFFIVLGANSVYNWLIELARRCDQAVADIDVHLRQRNDLIPNLVAIVKGYAAHEYVTLEAVARARSAAMVAEAGEVQNNAEIALASAIGHLFLVAEQYPDLKASTVFRQLQRDLAAIEHKIAASRRFLNGVVAEYNITRTRFPANIIAAICRFFPRDPGIVPEESRGTIDTAPSVAF